MKRRYPLLLALCALAVISTDSRAAAPTSYAFYCRGPLGVMAWESSAQVAGMYAPGPAGRSGGELSPGECSWPDRKLNSTEKPFVHFDPSTLSSFQSSLVNTCARDSECVLRLYVASDGGKLQLNPTQPLTADKFH